MPVVIGGGVCVCDVMEPSPSASLDGSEKDRVAVDATLKILLSLISHSTSKSNNPFDVPA
jgi:hypothetical protein